MMAEGDAFKPIDIGDHAWDCALFDESSEQRFCDCERPHREEVMDDDNAACAHLTVKYCTTTDSDNWTTGWWECTLCQTKFSPVDTAKLVAQSELWNNVLGWYMADGDFDFVQFMVQKKYTLLPCEEGIQDEH